MPEECRKAGKKNKRQRKARVWHRRGRKVGICRLKMSSEAGKRTKKHFFEDFFQKVLWIQKYVLPLHTQMRPNGFQL